MFSFYVYCIEQVFSLAIFLLITNRHFVSLQGDVLFNINTNKIFQSAQENAMVPTLNP